MLLTISKLNLKIKEFADYMTENQYAVNRIILYGSYAKGKPKPESDVDLAVWIDDKSDLDYDKLYALSSKFYPIHPKFYNNFDNENTDPFIEIIQKTGIEIELN
jgi:predicted nucleotidyltransferase